jgi:hypothetical protein
MEALNGSLNEYIQDLSGMANVRPWASPYLKLEDSEISWKMINLEKIPEENVLQGRAARLMSFGKSHLSLGRAGATTCFILCDWC